MSRFLCGSKSWTISSQMQKKLESTVKWLERRSLKIIIGWLWALRKWFEKNSNEKGHLSLGWEKISLRYLMRKDGLEKLELTWYCFDKKDKREQRVIYLTSLTGNRREIWLPTPGKDRMHINNESINMNLCNQRCLNAQYQILTVHLIFIFYGLVIYSHFIPAISSIRNIVVIL